MSPPDPAQDASSPQTSLAPPHALSVLPPTLSRATSTSALSAISVESTLQSSPRRLLSSVRARPALAELSLGDAEATGTPSSSRAGSLVDRSILSGGGGSTRSTPSRKGKERALPEDEDAEVGSIGTEGMGRKGGAASSLRRLAREEDVFGDGHKSAGIEGIELPREPERTRHTRQYFVLTDAGKPVFQSHPELNDHSATELSGVAQTLISIFADNDDRIRCINRGRHKIAFVLRSPLYFFCVSDWGEPEHILRIHLDYIHLQILSVVSSTQLSKAFQRRSNFDLSRLLEGTENFLHHLIDRAQYDYSFITSTLQPLRMNPVLREAAAASLIPPAKFRDLLYVLLIADAHIVTLLRPKKHSVHPSDLHLLLNMLSSSPALRSTETWIPLCLPKFNPAGFVHAYISYVSASLGLVFVSADREAFEELRTWRATVVQNLEKERTLQKIEQSIPQHSYTASALDCPGLLHFIYKSRQLVQITMPEWPAAYERDE